MEKESDSFEHLRANVQVFFIYNNLSSTDQGDSRWKKKDKRNVTMDMMPYVKIAGKMEFLCVLFIFVLPQNLVKRVAF